MDLVGRNSAVPTYEHFVSTEELGQKVSYLENGILVKINIVDTADVICMKCSHSIDF